MAVRLTRGTSLPTVGPGTSARMMCMECSPLMGITAIRNTSTPMPPIQWVNMRQNISPRGMASISVRMVAPVVDRPEAVSNRASM